MNLNQMLIEIMVKEQQERLLENARLGRLYSITRAHSKSPGLLGKIALRAAKLMISTGDRIKTRYEPAIQ
jgi:hypothetical protein